MEYTFQVIQPALVSTLTTVEASGHKEALAHIARVAPNLYPPHWYVLAEGSPTEGEFFISKSAGVLALQKDAPTFHLLSSGNFSS